MVIAIKGEDWNTTKETTKELIHFLSTNTSLFEQIFIHSFWHGAVKIIKESYPQVITAAIIVVGLPPKDMLQLILNANANGASIEKDFISEELVALAHDRNLFLNAWVLNDDVNFTRMKNIGVDGLITNYPGQFRFITSIIVMAYWFKTILTF